jgi:hypothetical protein
MRPGGGLNVTKDGFQDDPDPLWDEVAERCKEIFEKSKGMGESIELSGLARDLGDMLSQSLCGAKTIKARRDKGDGEGTVEPTGRGRKHRRCSKSQPGDSMVDPAGGQKRSKAFGRIDVQFDSTQAKVFEIAVSGAGARRNLTVTVNEEDPVIKAIRSVGEHEKGKLALYALIVSWISPRIESDEKLKDCFESIKAQTHETIVTELFAALAEKHGLARPPKPEAA